MKTIGIIGGMSAESTAIYYQLINRETNARLGGNHSADIVMHSVDFAHIVALQRAGDWEKAGETLAASACKLESIGADLILIATNTMHKVAPKVAAAIGIPLLHLVDATADALKKQGITRAGLLGTAFTMQDGFYAERMATHGIDIVVPDTAQQPEIHRIIFEELCVGRIETASKNLYLEAIHTLQTQGAQGIILGCTEIGLLIAPEDSPLPVFDSAILHALAAVDAALEGMH